MSEMTDFVNNHKPLVIGGMVIGVLLVGGYLLNKKTTNASASPNGLSDTSGLTNHLVYVPTQTSFITDNQNGVFANGDTQLKSISVSGGLYSNSPQVTNSTTSSTTTTNPPPVIVPPVVVPPIIIPPRPKPKNNHDHDHDGKGHRKRVDFVPPHGPQSFPGPGQPKPAAIQGPPVARNAPPPQATTATRGTLQWNQSHTLAGGESVSTVTAKVNRNLKAQGMPGAYAVSPHEVYAQNASVIVPQARTSPGDHLTAAHAGTRIVLPTWSN